MRENRQNLPRRFQAMSDDCSKASCLRKTLFMGRGRVLLSYSPPVYKGALMWGQGLSRARGGVHVLLVADVGERELTGEGQRCRLWFFAQAAVARRGSEALENALRTRSANWARRSGGKRPFRTQPASSPVRQGSKSYRPTVFKAPIPVGRGETCVFPGTWSYHP